MYLKNGRAKLEIALAKGKKLYDKRNELEKKDIERDISRTLKGRD
jgi:SsrA-binding protein